MESNPWGSLWLNRCAEYCCCGGLIETGGTLSTGGRDAHGDLTGVGTVGLATSVGFSDGPFRIRPPSFGCATADEPTFNMVAFGPTELSCFGAGALA